MYKSKNHAKHSLIVHLVFVVKYRYPLLIQLGEDVKRPVSEAYTKYKYELIVCEVDIDHIHILLEYKPKSSVSSVVKHLKQYTTYYLRQEHDDFISKFIYGES